MKNYWNPPKKHLKPMKNHWNPPGTQLNLFFFTHKCPLYRPPPRPPGSSVVSAGPGAVPGAAPETKTEGRGALGGCRRSLERLEVV